MHFSWCEDKAMDMSGKTVPSWSLHTSREMEKQTKNAQLLIVTSTMMKNSGGEEIVMEAIRLQLY